MVALKTLSWKVDEDGVGLIQFTRGDKLNSFIEAQYKELAATLQQFDQDDKVVVAVLTGSGRYFSSGHDLGEQARAMAMLMAEGADMEKVLAQRINEQAHVMISQWIDFSKPMLVAVNGPAFGVSVTCLQLADIVYASDTASFTTPFMKYGFCAEGCSSLLFPEVLGPSKANEMLLLGQTLSVTEAERCGFVAAVYPEGQLLGEVMQRARRMARYPAQALRDTKRIGRNSKRMAQLHETNDAELTLLVKRFMSEESANALAKFMMEQQAKKSISKL